MRWFAHNLLLTTIDDICTLSTMKKYNLYLSENQIESLEKISRERDISVSEIVRRALDDFIEKDNLKKLRLNPEKVVS